MLQGLPNQLALLTSNLPSGYHENAVGKGPIIDAIEEIKTCLDMFTSSLKRDSN